MNEIEFASLRNRNWCVDNFTFQKIKSPYHRRSYIPRMKYLTEEAEMIGNVR